MEPIIPPVAPEILESELTKEKFVRYTNYGNNEVYIFSAHDSPNLLREVGRLRELAFRSAGGGTGKEQDIDKYDLSDNPYQQLIVWEPEERKIIGGYRFFHCKNAPTNENGRVTLATSRLFYFSREFETDYLPYLIELGRSFVHPDYQVKKASRKGIFALDNLWDGLAVLLVENPDVKYFFGKVTMYKRFNTLARDLILYFLKRFFPDPDGLLTPIEPLQFAHSTTELSAYFKGNNYEDNYKILNQQVRANGENIPPLINSYMGLSPSMKTFGTAVNPHFGYVEETGILITIADIYESKSRRHVATYREQKAKIGSNL